MVVLPSLKLLTLKRPIFGMYLSESIFVKTLLSGQYGRETTSITRIKHPVKQEPGLNVSIYVPGSNPGVRKHIQRALLNAM